MWVESSLTSLRLYHISSIFQVQIDYLMSRKQIDLKSTDLVILKYTNNWCMRSPDFIFQGPDLPLGHISLFLGRLKAEIGHRE